MSLPKRKLDLYQKTCLFTTKLLIEVGLMFFSQILEKLKKKAFLSDSH